MSRTRRNPPKNRYFRHMKTYSEIKQNEQLFADIHTEDIPYPISKMNRMRRYIPDSWEDYPIASYFEIREND